MEERLRLARYIALKLRGSGGGGSGGGGGGDGGGGLRGTRNGMSRRHKFISTCNSPTMTTRGCIGGVVASAVCVFFAQNHKFIYRFRLTRRHRLEYYIISVQF